MNVVSVKKGEFLIEFNIKLGCSVNFGAKRVRKVDKAQQTVKEVYDLPFTWSDSVTNKLRPSASSSDHKKSQEQLTNGECIKFFEMWSIIKVLNGISDSINK